MTLSCLLLIPEGLTFDLLTPEQQAAISGVFGQYVPVMPGTVAKDGLVVCDAITADNFRPETMGDYGLGWPLLGLWNAETGEALMPVDTAAYLARLAPVVVTDEEGAVVTSTPATLHECHRWAGHTAREGLSDG